MPSFENNNSDFFYEYWIGKDINLKKYWAAYKDGKGYRDKFTDMQCHVFEITFDTPPKHLPLFNLEPIYKTLKSYYHELKKDILSRNEYGSAGPLFIYEVNRGSGIWTFLGELWYTLVLGTTLTEEKIKGQRLDNIEKKLRMLKEYFGDGNVRSELFENFMKADTPIETQESLQNLFAEKIKIIKISKHPFTGEIEENRKEMLEIKGLLTEGDETENRFGIGHGVERGEKLLVLERGEDRLPADLVAVFARTVVVERYLEVDVEDAGIVFGALDVAGQPVK